MSSTPDHTTTTSVNQLPPWLDQTGQLVATQGQQYLNQPYNALQNQAIDATGQYGNMVPGALGQANSTFMNGSNYQSDNSGYGPLLSMLGMQGGGWNQSGPQGGVNSYTGGRGGAAGTLDPRNAAQANVSQIDPSQLGTYQSGQLSNTNLDPYLNPYQQDVTDQTLAGLNQNLQLQLNNNDAGAASAGAFGGTRQAVQNALTNQASQQTAAQTLAQLNSANFAQAQQAGQFDITNQNAANQFNAGAQNSMLGQNATMQNAGDQFNAGQSNQFALNNAANLASMMNARTSAGAQVSSANQSANASMYNARLAAALGYGNQVQQGGYNAANLNQNAGQNLSAFGQQGLADMGIWGNQMYNQPMQNLSWYANAVGGIPSGSNSSQTAPGQGGANPWVQGLSTAAMMAMMYGG